MHKLIIRKDTKQAFSQAARIPMKDSLERLRAWVEVLNTEAGWNKYGAEAAA